ncbi:tetratricopeptide repeat protein [Marinomonas sp. 15G1-11]|uniref:Tetratricopeptide repeat protein n=1 Tax=Marinomonas phaeophyticola TaxID=3004091 RepID=A0ABT4JZJ4_9GAMM|nr:tetratricopeptide repeat protein [Marinomonas sp. 15G1-11]MCZ2723718.1 tetratricopeptide repeat protein [Marinomonas sp. 15G1-11]
MQSWEHLTRQANKAYSNNAFSEAVDLNLLALQQAERSFAEDFEEDPQSTLAAISVSFFNVAESYTALGDYISANRQYQQAVNFLQVVIVLPNLITEQRDQIMKTATHIRFEWDLFTQSYGRELSLQSKALMKSPSYSIKDARAVVHH